MQVEQCRCMGFNVAYEGVGYPEEAIYKHPT